MAAKGPKKEYVGFVTPIGTAIYPNIVEPDLGREFSDGKHKVNLRFSDEDHKAFKAKAEAAFKKLVPGVKTIKIPEKDVTLNKGKDDEETIQTFIFKSHKRPKIVDSRKQLVRVKDIGPGSRLIAVGSFAEYKGKGITAYLDCVQIIELKERFDVTSALGVVDGGFTADQADDSDFTDADDTASEGGHVEDL